MRLDPMNLRGRRSEAIGVCRFGKVYRGVLARRERTGYVVSLIAAAEQAASWPRAMRRIAARQGVAFAIQDLSLHHERLQLPPMEPALLARAVEQHCMASRAVGSDLEISHSAGFSTADAADLLIVSIDRLVSQSYADQVQADGFRPERFVSPSAALVALLRVAGRESLSAGSTAVIHLGSEIGSVAFVSDGAFVIGREFRMPEPRGQDGATGAGASVQPDTSRQDEILEEIDRSLLLFHHQLHGRAVQRILLSADDEPLEALRQRCAERFGIQAEALVDAVELDLSAFGDGELGRRRAGLWALPIATAVASLCDECAIDLLPAVSRAERARRRALAVSAALVLALGAGMGLHHALRVSMAAELARDLKSYETRQLEMDDQVAELIAVGSSRTTTHQRLDLLATKRVPVRLLRDALGVLAAAAPESLVVEQLDFGADPSHDSDLLLRVRGRVSAMNSADAQEQFARFHAALRPSPLFAAAEVRPIEIGYPAGSRLSVLTFDIVAHLNKEESRGAAWPGQ